MKKVAQKLRKGPREEGFTLVELLIVIVIIGILSGILIAVIDPVRQQNRSRNATIRATLNKLAFGLNTSRAGTGRLPGEDELTVELENILPSAACTGLHTNPTTDVLNCDYQMPGTSLPGNCNSADFAGANTSQGTSQCQMAVFSQPLITGQFRLWARVFEERPDAVAANDEVYLFDSASAMWVCPVGSPINNFANIPGAGALVACTRVNN